VKSWLRLLSIVKQEEDGRACLCRTLEFITDVRICTKSGVIT